MKKIGVMLIALLVLSVLFSSCAMMNPFKDTSWETTITESGVTGKITLSFTKDTVAYKTEMTMSGMAVSLTYDGTYTYSGNKATISVSGQGLTYSFDATIDKDTLVLSEEGASTDLKLTKVKK